MNLIGLLIVGLFVVQALEPGAGLSTDLVNKALTTHTLSVYVYTVSLCSNGRLVWDVFTGEADPPTATGSWTLEPESSADDI